MAGITAESWTCDTLFTFKNAVTASCSWQDATTVRMTFQSMNNAQDSRKNLIVGDTITLINGLIRAFCTSPTTACMRNPTATSTVLTVIRPADPSYPIVIINAPRKAGLCADLFLDVSSSYGSGGRPYNTVTWTVSGIYYENGAAVSVVNTTSIEAYLNGYSAVYQVSRPITVPKRHLDLGTYTFTLTTQNFLGLESSKSFDVDITNSARSVAVTILGPTYLSEHASSQITLFALASVSACTKSSTSTSTSTSSVAIKYAWHVQLGTKSVPVTSSSLDPSKFTLPPHALQVGRSYSITVTASERRLSSSATVTMFISQGRVIASIAGGYSRSNPVNKALVLDASASRDADVALGLQSNLTYQVSSVNRYHYNYDYHYHCHRDYYS